MSIENMKTLESSFRDEINDFHELVEKEQQSWERVTINDLNDTEKQQLEERNRNKAGEIQFSIKLLMEKELSSEQKDRTISELLSYFWANAKIDYSYKTENWLKSIKTSKIKDFFEKIKDWKLPFVDVEVSNIKMDEKIHKLETIPWEYTYEQKINSITFSN